MANDDHTPDQEIASLIESAAPGVGTAMAVFEEAESVYFGAVVAMTTPQGTTTSATTPYVSEVQAS